MGAAIAIGLIVVVGFWGLSSLVRSGQKAAGHAKCVFCGKRLKKVTAGYATHCKACGREQPWAVKKTA